MYRFTKLTLLLFCLTLMTTVFAQQQERIIRFHSDIKIETDGRIEVAEHIRVYAGGNEIKRGIVRKLLLYRENNKGKKVKMDYKILSVQCNGADTKYRTEHRSEKLEVYIGDAEALLSAGEYDYTIVYESYGQATCRLLPSGTCPIDYATTNHLRQPLWKWQSKAL